VLARRGSLFAKEGKYTESIAAYEKSLIEDGVQKVRDELRAVKKMKKDKDDQEYLNPELAEKACEEGNTVYK
jgi:stress-induced-phosphoprotein 1